MEKSEVVRHYSREDVQKEILRLSNSREVSVRFNDYFGKRPDTIKYKSDITENVKKGATSFHLSVERWSNPMRLSTSMKKSELDELRSGWDLLFDIDIPEIELSKILAYLIIRALRDNGIKSVSIKFSGNKGFHIGIPYEAFPTRVPIKLEEGYETKETRYFFPDGMRKISEYLMDYISKKYTELTDDKIIFGDYEYPIDKISKMFSGKDLFIYTCKRCNKRLIGPYDGRKIEFLCEKCGSSENVDFTLKRWNTEKKCECGFVMNKKQYFTGKCEHEVKKAFDMSVILEVDRHIFSSRHMYRMVYSLHEKSGLVSIPFNPDKVMKFQKKYAEIRRFKISKHRFLDANGSSSDEGASLMKSAIDFNPEVFQKKPEKKIHYDDFTQKIPKELFPPCMINGLKGMSDGKKRFLFALKNFLICCNYSFDEIEEIVNEWNEKNEQKLKETVLIGQIRYSKSRKEQILPPNCFYSDKKEGFYLDIGVCKPDDFCPKIKNPFNYSKLKTKLAQNF